MRNIALLSLALATGACRDTIDERNTPADTVPHYDPDDVPVAVDTDTDALPVDTVDTDSVIDADTDVLDTDVPVAVDTDTYNRALDLCLSPYSGISYSTCPVDTTLGVYPMDCMAVIGASNNELIAALHPTTDAYSDAFLGGTYDSAWQSFVDRIGFDPSVVAYFMDGNDLTGNFIDHKTALVTFGEQLIEPTQQSSANLYPNLPIADPISVPHHALGGVACTFVDHVNANALEFVRQVSLVQPDGTTAQFSLQLIADVDSVRLTTTTGGGIITFEATYPASEWDLTGTRDWLLQVHTLSGGIQADLPIHLPPVQDAGLSIDASSGHFPAQ